MFGMLLLWSSLWKEGHDVGETVTKPHQLRADAWVIQNSSRKETQRCTLMGA